MATDQQTAPTSSVVADILKDAQELIKQQLAMFRLEVQDDLRKTRTVAVLMAIGAVVCLLGAVLFGFAVAYLISWAFPGFPLWASFGVIALALLATGGGLILAGKQKLSSFNPLPDRSAEAVKENLQWLTRPK
jgi:hypothetical protein